MIYIYNNIVNYIFKYIVYLSLTFSFGSLLAQTPLQVYQDTAAQNNPGIQALYKQYEVVMQRVPQTSTLPDPTIGFGYFINAVETRVGPQRAVLSVSQSFPWFGKLGAQEQANTERALAVLEKYYDQRSKLNFDVAETYNTLYVLRSAIRIMEDNIELLNTFKGLANVRFESGKGSMVDVLRIEMELDELINQLAYLQDSKRPLVTRFEQLLNTGLNQKIDFPDVLWDDELGLSKELIMDLETTPLSPTLTLDLLPASSDGSYILLNWSEADTKDQDIKQYNVYRSAPGGGTSCPVEVATILTPTRIIDIYGGAGLDGETTPLLILSDGSTYRPSTYLPDFDTTPDSDADAIINFGTEHFLLDGLDTGTTYVFKVALTDFTDLTASSDTVTTVMIPGSPLSLTATMGHQVVKLHWTLSSDPNVFKYNIYRAKIVSDDEDEPKTDEYQLIGATLSSSSKPWRYNDKDIEDYQLYYYFVKAVDRIANLESYASNIVTSSESSFNASQSSFESKNDRS